MKEKGFTLIELLAVIVILAIIALIAVPIIIDIIEDSKKEAQKRSAENYTKAVKNAIVSSQLDGSKGITGSFTTDTLSDVVNVKYDGEKVSCDTIKIYEDGSLYITGCSVGGKSIEYTYGKSKQLCTFANEGEEGKVGAKYTCKVNNKDTFTFYITNLLDIAGKTISQSDTETKVEYYDLILDSNICEDGSLDTNDECSSVWVSETDYNSYAVGKGVGYNQNGCIDKGPITAMKYLYNSTKSWTNVPTISLSYEDRHTDGLGRPGSVGVPYGGIISNGTTTEIRMNDGTVTATFENMKARLPRFFDTIYNSDGTNIWTFETCGQGGPCSSQNYALFYAWGAQSDYSSIKSSYKIRPVITVLPSDLGL